MEVGAGLDRFFTIVYPNRFKFVTKKYFRFIIVALVFIYNFAFYSKVLFEFNLVLNDEFNKIECVNKRIIEMDKMDFLNSTTGPFLIMFVTSVVLLTSICRSRKGARSNASRVKTRDLKFGVTLIILNVTFFLLNAPRRLFYFLGLRELFGENIVSVFIVNLVVVSLYDIFYSASFWIQFMVNSLVRKNLLRMVCL